MSDTKEQKPVAWAVFNGWALVRCELNEQKAFAFAKSEQLKQDLAGSLAAFFVKPVYAAPVPNGATHCDNCGLTWLDDGLNPIGCPYCKVDRLIRAAAQALEALESSRVFVTSREKIKHPEGTEWYDEIVEALRREILSQQAGGE